MLGQSYKFNVATTGKPSVVYIDAADNPRDGHREERRIILPRRNSRPPAAGTVRLRVEDNEVGEEKGEVSNGTN